MYVPQAELKDRGPEGRKARVELSWAQKEVPTACADTVKKLTSK